MTRYVQGPADLLQDIGNRRPRRESSFDVTDASGASIRRRAVRRRGIFLAAMRTRVEWVTGLSARLPFLRVPDWSAIAWTPRAWAPRMGEPMVVLVDREREAR